ncbi:MAG: phosphoribosylaminoimidazolesuccinocarboxamide synthase [Deltaproteobacteria bacterium]|nr:phosphoribosylaminoimidazolesuccinocarboxamide synthase [Deltaproteobacteria bacterium]
MYETNIKQYPLTYRGKVRDVYDLGEDLLIVTTDRISAFDVILPVAIPKKGYVLTQLTEFWLDKFRDVVPSHRSNKHLRDVIEDQKIYDAIKDQAVVVKKAKPLPIECVVRGYLLGTGYKEYIKSGHICGIELPRGLRMAEKLPEPLFTPTTKAALGAHDENVTFEQVVDTLGFDLATQVRAISIKLYSGAARYAAERGIIIADTKFEFGMIDNRLTLIDEVLTCDSSRFWSLQDYKVGISPPSYDKQIIRDYLETLDWDKKAPGPMLPDAVIKQASERYQEVLKKLM